MHWPRLMRHPTRTSPIAVPGELSASHGIGLAAIAVALIACGDDSSGPPNQQPSNLKPSADFDLACTRLECSFTGHGEDYDGTIAAWSWDFGDATGPSAERNPVHAYAADGQYRVTLTVTDNDGARDSAARDLAVPGGFCANASAPDDFVPCLMDVPSGMVVSVTISSESDCTADGDTLRIVPPAGEDIFTNGCHAEKDVPILVNGGNPFLCSTGYCPTQLYLAVTLQSGDPRRLAPSVHTEGGFPQWTARFEDGGHPTNANEPDYNDLVVTFTAMSPTNTNPWDYLRQPNGR